MSTYEITDLPALTLLQYTGSVPDQPSIGPAVGGLFARLLSAMADLGLDPDAPTVAWYDDGPAGQVDIGVGCPVEAALPAAAGLGLVAADLPAHARAVTCRLRGSLEAIGPAWAGLYAHLHAEGLTPTGPCREVYLEGDVDSPGSWVIDLQQPVL